MMAALQFMSDRRIVFAMCLGARRESLPRRRPLRRHGKLAQLLHPFVVLCHQFNSKPMQYSPQRGTAPVCARGGVEEMQLGKVMTDSTL